MAEEKPAFVNVNPAAEKYEQPQSPKQKYNASFSVDGRNESDFYTGIKPLGPQRQGMDTNMGKMLLPAYEKTKPVFEIALDDTKSRVARLTTLCYLFTCQGFGTCSCCSPVCEEFFQFDIELQKKKMQRFCFSMETDVVVELPQQIQSVVEADQSTQHGDVKLYERHLVIKRCKGLTNDIIVIPILAIQKMKIEEVDPGMNYGFTACCSKIRCFPLAKSVQRLKLYGRNSANRIKSCGIGCTIQEKRIGIACIMTNRAEELMEEIQKAIGATGEKPHGDAFIHLQVNDPFGQALVRGSVTIVGRQGEAALPAEAIRVASKEYISFMQGYQLKAFLTSRGYKHNIDGQNLEQLRDEAYALYASQFGTRYQENQPAFENDPVDLACLPECLRGKGAKKSSPLCFGCNVPELPILAANRKKRAGEQEAEPDESPAAYAMRMIQEELLAQAKELVFNALRPTPLGIGITVYETYETIQPWIPNVPKVLDSCFNCVPKMCQKFCKFQYVNADAARGAYVFKGQTVIA